MPSLQIIEYHSQITQSIIHSEHPETPLNTWLHASGASFSPCQRHFTSESIILAMHRRKAPNNNKQSYPPPSTSSTPSQLSTPAPSKLTTDSAAAAPPINMGPTHFQRRPLLPTSNSISDNSPPPYSSIIHDNIVTVASLGRDREAEIVGLGMMDIGRLSRRSQWIVLAVASGACAAFNGVFAKL